VPNFISWRKVAVLSKIVRQCSQAEASLSVSMHNKTSSATASLNNFSKQISNYSDMYEYVWMSVTLVDAFMRLGC